uniref:Hypotheticial protein n=1 Tax=Schistosoma japonicum TaxID=6182 RepID=C1LE65_SCHJA|nr:hypotheticial protein [Schistosoma japonicum]
MAYTTCIFLLAAFALSGNNGKRITKSAFDCR